MKLRPVALFVLCGCLLPALRAESVVPGYVRTVVSEAYGGYEGVTFVKYEKLNGLFRGRAWLMKFDLSKGYRFRTQHGHGEMLRATVKDLAEQVEKDGFTPICGINADYFYQNQFPDAKVHAHSTGMCITDSRMVYPGYDNNADMHMRFIMELPDHTIVHGIPTRTDGRTKGNPSNSWDVAYNGSKIRNAVRTCWGKNNYPVSDGKIATGLPGRDTDPRSLIGLGKNAAGHDQIVLFVSDGRQPLWSLGVPYPDCVRMMVYEGCTEVGAFDGGGSAAMWAKGYGQGPLEMNIVNKPSDGRLRKDANGVFMLAPNPNRRVAARVGRYEYETVAEASAAAAPDESVLVMTK